MNIFLRYCTGKLVRDFIFLSLAVTLLVWAPATIADSRCAQVKSQAPAVILSEAETLKLRTEWKRAIDQDKATDLWRLLSEVDANRIDVNSTNDKGKTALMASVKVGDQCLLEELLRRGLRITDKGYTGGTVLMYAVLGNQKKMIDLILLREQELNSQSTNGWTAVMIAAAKGFKVSMQQLHTAGADINLPDVYLWTPLMRAIDNRHSSVVEFLLSQPEIDVGQINENGSTALHIAAQTGDEAIVTKLLELGAGVTATDKNGFTASDVAIEYGHARISEVIDDRP